MRKKLISILLCSVIVLGMVGCGSSGEEATEEETTEEETAEEAEPVVYEITNSTGDSVGEYSILEIPQSEATLEYLTDWYVNYVIPSGHRYDFIIYSDRDDDLGVWANDVTMDKDVYLIESESGGYTEGGNTSTSASYELQDGELVEIWNNEESAASVGKTPEEALKDYVANGYEYPARWDFIDELEYEGYPEEEAKAAVESFDFDWNELAVEDLQTAYEIYGDVDTAIEQLRDDDFTEEEIQYAVDKLGLK